MKSKHRNNITSFMSIEICLCLFRYMYLHTWVRSIRILFTRRLKSKNNDENGAGKLMLNVDDKR